ncbi:MAG: aspartyl/asparaginyl beta-hydroxylase domain-containing protein [Bacteroidota bacterium]
MEQLLTKNPNKTKSMRALGAVDISAVRAAILSIPEAVWQLENEAKPNKFREFHSTTHIVFKFVESFKDYTKYYEKPIWEKWKARLQPLLDQAVVPYGYTEGHFSRVMLARLDAGGHINAHRDGKLSAVFPHKIHIPIQTNPKCTFFVNPKTYQFEEGFAYEVNNQAVHYVENLGDSPRIHLIFEYWGKP